MQELLRSRYPDQNELADLSQHAQLLLVGIFQAVDVHILIVTNYKGAIEPLAKGEVNTVPLLYLFLTLVIIGAITLLYLIQVIYYRWPLTADHHGILWFGIAGAEFVAAHSPKTDTLGIWFVAVGGVALLGMMVYYLDLREVRERDPGDSAVQSRQWRQVRGHCREMLVTMAIVCAVSFLLFSLYQFGSFLGLFQFGAKENVHVATVGAGLGLAIVAWIFIRVRKHANRFRNITSGDCLQEDRVWAVADWLVRHGASISRSVWRRVPILHRQSKAGRSPGEPKVGS